MTTQKVKSENVIIEETQIIGDKIHIIWYDKTIKSEKYNETQIEALDFIKRHSESYLFDSENAAYSIMTIESDCSYWNKDEYESETENIDTTLSEFLSSNNGDLKGSLMKTLFENN